MKPLGHSGSMAETQAPAPHGSSSAPPASIQQQSAAIPSAHGANAHPPTATPAQQTQAGQHPHQGSVPPQTPQSQSAPLPAQTPTYVPASASPPKSSPTKSTLKALPTVRDHTTDQLGPGGDEYLPREIDEAGEKKVMPNGQLLGGRQYRCRTFLVPNRGDKLFMLATECARVLSYRDSYLLFNKNRSLFKIIANQQEKDDLVQQEILPFSYRSRQTAIVTARSMFRQFGSRMIEGGWRVKDDYWETKALKQGFTEADPAGQKRPGGLRDRELAKATQDQDIFGVAEGEIIYDKAPSQLLKDLEEIAQSRILPRRNPQIFTINAPYMSGINAGTARLATSKSQSDEYKDRNTSFSFPKPFNVMLPSSGSFGLSSSALSTFNSPGALRAKRDIAPPSDSGYASIGNTFVPPSVAHGGGDEDKYDDEKTQYSSPMTVGMGATQQSIIDICSDIHSRLRPYLNDSNRDAIATGLPELLKAFAIRIGMDYSSDLNPRIMRFIHGNRRRVFPTRVAQAILTDPWANMQGRKIAAQLHTQLSAGDEDPNLDAPKKSDKMPLESLMEMWARKSSGAEAEPEASDLFQGVNDQDDEDLDQTKLAGYIINSPVYRWLVMRLLKESSLSWSGTEPSTMVHKIRNSILGMLPTGIISKRERPKSHIMTFILSRERIESRLRKERQMQLMATSAGIGNSYVLTGETPDVAQLITIKQYLTQTWSQDSVALLQALCNLFDTDAPHSGKLLS